MRANSLDGSDSFDKMRNILEKVRKCDYDQVKLDAQAIYQSSSRTEAQRAWRTFAVRWRKQYPAMVRRMEGDLPQLLSFYRLAQHLWKKLRTPTSLSAASWR